MQNSGPCIAGYELLGRKKTGLNIDVVVRFVLHLVLNCETENILKTNVTMEEFLILIKSFYSFVCY